jgi:3-oxoadipate enol-lactonase
VDVAPSGLVTCAAAPVMLLHGAGRAGRMWRRPARLLADRHPVLAPDLPGFGSAGPPFTLAGAAAAVTRAAGAVGGGVHLVGMSLGGTVAVRAVTSEPDLFASLLLCAAPVAPGRRQPRTVRRYRRCPDALGRLFSDAWSWRALVEAVAAIDIEPELPRVAVPTLVVCGRRDRAALPDARLLADAIPGADLLVIGHAGHGWPVTAPALFATVVEGAVRRAGSRG